MKSLFSPIAVVNPGLCELIDKYGNKKWIHFTDSVGPDWKIVLKSKEQFLEERRIYDAAELSKLPSTSLGYPKEMSILSK